MNIKETTQVYLYFIVVSLVQMFISPMIFTYLYNHYKMNIGLANSAVHFLTFVPCAVIFILLNSQSFKETLSFKKTPLINIMFAVLIGMLAQPIMSFLAHISQLFVTDTVGAFMEQVTPLSFFAMFFAMAITPAITEEITMRGVVLHGFKDKNMFVAATVNGLLFAIFHFNLSQFLYAFALGFLFAIMVRITGSIFVTMVCHMTINGIQVALAKFLVFAPGNEALHKEAVKEAAKITIAQRLDAISIIGVIAIAATALIVLVLKAMKYYTDKQYINVSKPVFAKVDIEENTIQSQENIKENTWKLFINPWMAIIVALYIVATVVLK